MNKPWIWCLVAVIAVAWADYTFAQRGGGARIPPPPPPMQPSVRIPIPAPPILPSPIRPDGETVQDTLDAAELLALVPSSQQAVALAAVLAQRGLTPARTTTLDFLGTAMVAFPSPGGLADGRVTDLPDLFPGLILAPNGAVVPATEADQDDPRAYGPRLVGWHQRFNDCGGQPRIGMIDTGVDLRHPALVERQVTQRWLVDEARDADLLAHGTGIAGLLIGSWPEQGIDGLLPNAELLSAGIFVRDEDGAVTASVEHTVVAIDWLGAEKAHVVNLSVAGPANAVLDRTVNLAAKSGLPLVAAAGNGGPDGPHAYPAASTGALAVTALDPRRRVYRHATRGAYIDVAAPGVDIWTATPAGGGAYRSGTSMATPFVAAMIAVLRVAQPWSDVETLYTTVRGAAEDLGDRGHDRVFGWGLAHLPAEAACDGPAATAR